MAQSTTKTPQSFEYKEIDQEGMETLEVIAQANKFNAWMYQTIKPYCKGTVLEIGSGIGNISNYFIQDNFKIYLTELRQNYCDRLIERFKDKPNVQAVIKMDVVDPDFDTLYANLIGQLDTVYALNVVEHIENDQLAINNCVKFLKPGGHLIILVPAYQMLYNKFDEELYHYRRYTKSTLNPLFDKAGLKIIKSFYFNFAGIFGWWLSGKIQKNKTIPEGQMKAFNYLVPIAQLADAIVFRQMGLSVITVGQKP